MLKDLMLIVLEPFFVVLKLFHALMRIDVLILFETLRLVFEPPFFIIETRFVALELFRRLAGRRLDVSRRLSALSEMLLDVLTLHDVLMRWGRRWPPAARWWQGLCVGAPVGAKRGAFII